MAEAVEHPQAQLARRNASIEPAWRPRNSEVRVRFPGLFVVGEFGTVTLPRTKLDQSGISKEYRALPTCHCGKDYQSRLGIVAEILNPRSKRLMRTVVDAPSFRGSGRYA